MPETLPIFFGQQQLTLLADRALYWPREKTLVLADVHLGKDASFRAAGLSVPAGNSAKDLRRISILLDSTRAQRLVVLGDLVHSKASHQAELAEAFLKWRVAHSALDILLIGGNHDRRAGPTPVEWKITQVKEPYESGSLLLGHQPRETEKPLLCGHVHPSVSVEDYDRSLAKLCCFVVDPMQMILPAFGSFTGGYKMHRQPGRRIYATAGKSVIALPEAGGVALVRGG